MVTTFIVGVYSQHFANGGVQIFFMGFINVYVYALCFVNYPVLIRLPVDETLEVENAVGSAFQVGDHIEASEVIVNHQEIEMYDVSAGEGT